MSDFDPLVDRACAASGADFAFLLTRRGRLVTKRAPREMPEAGRTRILRAARDRNGAHDVIHLEMPRQDLVPYGGAAPVNVYVGVAADQAILCLVLPTWAERRRALPALEAGLRGLERLIYRGGRAAAKAGLRAPPSSRKFPGAKKVLEELLESASPPAPAEAAATEPAQADPGLSARVEEVDPAPPTQRTPGSAPPPASASQAPASSPPPPSPPPPSPPPPATPSASRRGVMAGLIGMASGKPSAARSLARAAVIREAPRQRGRHGSTPEIRLGEATLGRESLAAIGRELGTGDPGDVPLGDARSSAPEISTGEAPIGRETLAAIAAEGAPRETITSSPESVRVELASISPESERTIARAEATQSAASPRVSLPLVVADRDTKPWIESPADAKRAADAARRARRRLPRLEPAELDPEALSGGAAFEELRGRDSDP